MKVLLNPTHSSDFVEGTFCIHFFRQDVSMLMRRQEKHSSKNTISSPEPVVSWSRGLETRGFGSSRYQMSENL